MTRILPRLIGIRKSRLKDMNKTKTTFEIDEKAFGTEVMQADWMLKCIESEAKGQASSDQHLKPFIGFDRAKAIIYPNTKEHPK